ncbi:MAG: hypothetical protein R2854_11615 [Caldilineaceae bacterium]
MTVVAKAMSNGYPMGAVVGSRAVMPAAACSISQFVAWSDNIGLAAPLTTIREPNGADAENRLPSANDCVAFDEAIAGAGLTGAMVGFHSGPTLHLDLPDESLRPQVNTLFHSGDGAATASIA